MGTVPLQRLPGSAGISGQCLLRPVAVGGGVLQPPRIDGNPFPPPATTTTTAVTTAVSSSFVVARDYPLCAPSYVMAQPPPAIAAPCPDPLQFPAPPVLAQQSTLNPQAPQFSQTSYPGEVDTQDHVTQMSSVQSPDASMRSQEALTRSLVDAVRQNRLPVQEPPVFRGDPLAYPAWRSTFALLIERQSIPEEEKLIYLQKYVGGAAKEAISGLFLLRSPTALKEALATLEQRFGSPFIVAQAFREKLDSWPAVKANDGEGLRKLADFTRQTVVASKVVGQMGILDDAQYQKNLLSRLPQWLMRKWAQIVDAKKRDCLRYPTFEELSAFLTSQANITCEPIFGSSNTQGQSRTSAQSSSSSDKAKSTLNTDVSLQLTQKEIEFVKALVKEKMEDKGSTDRTPSGTTVNSTLPRPSVRPCAFCKAANHQVVSCLKLAAKPMQE